MKSTATLNSPLRFVSFMPLVIALSSGIAFAPIIAGAQTHPPQPTLRETLDWLNGTSEQESGDGDEHITFESEGCHAVITEYRAKASPGFYIRTAFALSDIDPNDITVVNLEAGAYKELFAGKSSVRFHTRNYVQKMLNSDAQHPAQIPTSWYEFTTASDFAPRFAKAMKRAAELCGGKPSSF